MDTRLLWAVRALQQSRKAASVRSVVFCKHSALSAATVRQLSCLLLGTGTSLLRYDQLTRQQQLIADSSSCQDARAHASRAADEHGVALPNSGSSKNSQQKYFAMQQATARPGENSTRGTWPGAVSSTYSCSSTGKDYSSSGDTCNGEGDSSNPHNSQGGGDHKDAAAALAKWRLQTSRWLGPGTTHAIYWHLQMPQLSSWYQLYPEADPTTVVGPFHSCQIKLIGVRGKDLNVTVRLLKWLFKLEPFGPKLITEEGYPKPLSMLDKFKGQVDRGCNAVLEQYSRLVTQLVKRQLQGSSPGAIPMLQAANYDLRSDGSIEQFKELLGEAVSTVLQLYSEADWEALKPMVSPDLLQAMMITYEMQMGDLWGDMDAVIEGVSIDINQVEIVSTHAITSKQLAAVHNSSGGAKSNNPSIGADTSGTSDVMWDVVHVYVEAKRHATRKSDDSSPFAMGRWSKKISHDLRGWWVFCRGPVPYDQVAPAWFVLAWL